MTFFGMLIAEVKKQADKIEDDMEGNYLIKSEADATYAKKV